MNTAITYSKATDPQPPTPERDIDADVSDLMTWGSTTLPAHVKDVCTADLVLELTEEITADQLQHAFSLALCKKDIELGAYFRELLTAQAEKMIEHEIKRAA